MLGAVSAAKPTASVTRAARGSRDSASVFSAARSAGLERRESGCWELSGHTTSGLAAVTRSSGVRPRRRRGGCRAGGGVLDRVGFAGGRRLRPAGALARAFARSRFRFGLAGEDDFDFASSSVVVGPPVSGGFWLPPEAGFSAELRIWWVPGFRRGRRRWFFGGFGFRRRWFFHHRRFGLLLHRAVRRFCREVVSGCSAGGLFGRAMFWRLTAVRPRRRGGSASDASEADSSAARRWDCENSALPALRAPPTAFR